MKVEITYDEGQDRPLVIICSETEDDDLALEVLAESQHFGITVCYESGESLKWEES